MKMIEAALAGNEPDHIVLENEAMSDVLDVMPLNMTLARLVVKSGLIWLIR